MRILCFDVGGTKISSAIISEQGKIISDILVYKTPQNASSISELYQNQIQKNNFDGVSIATAGLVCNNKVLAKPNNLPLGYENIDFGANLNKKITLVNDANAALLAEYTLGSLKDSQYSLMLTLGTAVGCGIIIDGKIYEGKKQLAGEVRFPIGGNDLFEIACQNKLHEFDCYKIFDLAKNNNEIALKIYNIWQQRLLDALIKLNNLLDVEIISLSGSLAKIVDYEYVNQQIKNQFPNNYFKVQQAYFQNNAGLIGASLFWSKK